MKVKIKLKHGLSVLQSENEVVQLIVDVVKEKFKGLQSEVILSRTQNQNTR